MTFTCGGHCQGDGVEEGSRQKKRKRSSLLFGQQYLLNSLPRQIFCTRTILRGGMDSFFLQIILVQFILLFKSVPRKTACVTRNWINSSPQIEATTFAFSVVVILLLWEMPTVLQCGLKKLGHTDATPRCSHALYTIVLCSTAQQYCSLLPILPQQRVIYRHFLLDLCMQLCIYE